MIEKTFFVTKAVSCLLAQIVSAARLLTLKVQS